MRKPLVACIAFTLVALAAGCGGGSGGALPATGSGGGSGAAGSANSAVVIAIPPKATDALGKTPAYVSPNTASIGIVVTPQGGTAYPAVIANVPGPSCTAASGGGYTCTVTVTATYGIDTVTITAYSAANAGGSILSSGSITSTFSATASPSPALNAVLTGVVKNIGLSIVHGAAMDPYVPVGQSATLNVVGKDASGAVIVGTYDTPISVSLPANSGLALASSTFADSTHTTSQISYLGGPTYYTAPTSAITITATAGATTATAAFDPTSTSLQFPAGDGSANATEGVNIVRYGSKLVYETRGSSDGELVSLDPTDGALTTVPSLGFLPNGSVYNDPTYNDLWIGSEDETETGVLNCFTSPSAASVPIPVPTAGTVDPFEMTLDHSNNLWFTNGEDLLGHVRLTGQCQTDGNPPVYDTVPNQDEDTTYLSGIVTDAAVDRIWAGDGDNPQYFSANASPSPPPQAYELTRSAFGMNDMTRDGSGNVVATVYDEPSFIATMPAGTGNFSTFVDLPGSTYPTYITTQTSAGGLVAFGDGGYGGVGIYAPADPTHLAVLGLPAATDGCEGVAFDNAGAPWVLCELTGDQRVTHSATREPQFVTAIGPALFRIVLTDAWNVFVTTTGLPQGEQENVGIGGGSSALTFTVACTGNVTCNVPAAFPREVSITAGPPGEGTMTVTGSDGRSVETDFTTTEHVSSGPRRPAGARIRPAGAHGRTP